jgi:dihydroorotase-like cyclic amidohydrolase
VLIEGGRIVALRRGGLHGTARISASGCRSFPGGVDPHTHLLGDLKRATISALHGGTTTAFTFPLPSMLLDFRRTREWKRRDAATPIGGQLAGERLDRRAALALHLRHETQPRRVAQQTVSPLRTASSPRRRAAVS